MKSSTDIEQSKKLSEILLLESADMYYDRYGDPYFINVSVTHERIKNDKYHHLIPCWSLAALLSVIPEPDLVQNSEGTWLVRSWINAYPWSVGGYSNPVDACVEMIIKLNESNLL